MFQMVLSQILKSNKITAKIRSINKEFVNKLDFKSIKFPFQKETNQKQKNKIIYPLMYLAMKMKHHTVFILPNKLLTTMLTYCNY